MKENATALRHDCATVISRDPLVGTLLALWIETRLGFARVTVCPDMAADTPDECAALAVLDAGAACATGPQTVVHMRRLFPAARILVLSETRQPEEVFDYVRAGAAGVMGRDTPERQLIRTMRVMLDGIVALPDWVSVGQVTEGRVQGAPRLTPRQRQVLTLVVEGASNKQIARRLDLAEGTVKCHVAALLRGLGVATRAAASAQGARLLDGGYSAGGGTALAVASAGPSAGPPDPAR